MGLIPIILSGLALVVAVYALIVALNAKSRSDARILEHYLKKMLDDYYEPRLKRHLKEELESELYRRDHPLPKSSGPAPIVEPAPMLPPKPTVTEDKKDDQSSIEPKTENLPSDEPNEISLPEPVSIYVGSYKTGSFKYSSPGPDDKTIYCITTSSKDSIEGVINLDPNAYRKVGETPDYLEGACIVSGDGLQVKVTKPGSVIKKDGKWEVSDQIEVELF